MPTITPLGALINSADEDTLTVAAGIISAKTGLMQLVEQKRVTGSAITNYDFTVDGDADYQYIMIAHIEASNNISVKPRMNGATIAGNKQALNVNGNAVSGTRDTTISLGDLSNTDTGEYFVIFDNCASNYNRRFISHGSTLQNGSIQIFYVTCHISTPANGTAITSIGIEGSAATGLGIGSVISLYRVKVV